MKYKDQFIKIGNQPVIQITKKTAKAIYDKGKAIFLNPCNTRLNSVWRSPIELKKDVFCHTFELMNNEFIYYNCTAELGKYPNYFTNPENIKES
jgi:hypothetical protein